MFSRATTIHEIRTPIFEDTQLFSRSVGEETDIVSKEMFTWEDKARAQSEKAQSLTLRPENTAGVVRAYIEHGLDEKGTLQKLYYIGPQFRRERPQKGRYRQFFQIGAEMIGPPSAGSESPARDAEVLEMLATLLDEVGLTRLEPAAELGGLCRRSRALQPGSARGVAAGRPPDVRRLPAPGGDQSAARARLQGSGRPADHREAAEDRPVSRRGLPRALRGREGHARCGRRAVLHQRAHGARPRLLHAHDVRVHARRPGRAECGAGRRTLRRIVGIAGRAEGSGHRLCHRRRPADPGAASVRANSRPRKIASLHRSAGRWE